MTKTAILEENFVAEIIIDCGSYGKVQVAEPIDGFELLKHLTSKPKNAIVLEIDGVLKDLSTVIDKDCSVAFITQEDPDSLEILRHDAAHVMAEAVKELYPETQVTIGPAIEEGFYYDFARDKSFIPEDLEKIEKRMHEIVSRNEKISREVWDRDEAIVFFKKQGEHFKAEIIADIPANEPVTLYRQGEFIDLCRGPHLSSTGKLGKAFKLMKLAGAYWRGDSSQPMLQRIYGTAWWKKEDLEDYLKRLEEAEKRDHRRLGREMSLFHFQEEAPGDIFWHPKGWTLYRLVENYIRKRLEEAGYCEVKTPQLLDRHFWEKSGHWDKFRDEMFILETEGRVFSLKPMNCPCHMQIFKQGIKSYKDLPIRMAEFGSCHRFEPSGALHGIMRVRAFVQDDAHIFCMEDQVNEETQNFCKLLQQVYKDFGFEDVVIKFSDRPEKRAGSDEMWDKAEKALRQAAEVSDLAMIENPGDGAFYGPKLDFVLRDAIGREWQCGTLQADFVLPERLGATYVGADGQKHYPVVLHRAILGSLERFIGVLIEHNAGHLPLWLSPIQAVVATITEEANDYAKHIGKKLEDYGIRYELDLRNEKISYKIREHSLAKVPLILVVGRREAEQNQVAIRKLGSREQQILDLTEALKQLKQWTKAPVKI